MPESAFTRLWNAIKPPPPAEKRVRKPMTAQRRKQWMMISGVLIALLAGGAAWEIYGYVSSAPDRARAKFDEAMKNMGQGNYERAVNGFSRALSIWPQMADAYIERGVARHYLKDDDQALADLDHATQIDPSLGAPYTVRGTIYRDRGDMQRAMQAMTKGIDVQPGLDAYYERGQLYEALGDHAKAIEDYDQAISYMRYAPHVYRARAYAKAGMGDEEGAKTDRQIAFSLEHR